MGHNLSIIFIIAVGWRKSLIPTTIYALLDCWKWEELSGKKSAVFLEAREIMSLFRKI